MKESNQLKLTLEEAREMLDVYGVIPDVPKGYTAASFSLVPYGQETWFISSLGQQEAIHQNKIQMSPIGKRIILQPPPKKYRYVTDGLESERRPGDYVYLGTEMKEYRPGFHFPAGLKFTREEAPQ